MTWPVEWPAGANIAEADPIVKSYAEQYAVRTLRLLTAGRVGGGLLTVLPETSAQGRADAIYLAPPVGLVESVTVAGLPLLPSAYAVENGNLLVRTDGGSWPLGAITITYQNSYPADALAQRVAGVLAWEYLKLLANNGKGCRLPSSVTSVTRQGLSMELAVGMFPEGMTKIPEVDTFIVQWNPHGLKARPTVITPDLPAHRTVTWRAP